MTWHNILIESISRHSELSDEDIAGIYKLTGRIRGCDRNEDVLRQGDMPIESAVVMEGMVARYHTAPNGRRQYLSFHYPGDIPDAQSLFLKTMDFSLCSIDKAILVMIPHKSITDLFRERPNIGLAIWKETLIEGAIFREAITNNSSRDLQTRIAHFFCEQYYRAIKTDFAENGQPCRLPLTQTQLAETLGSSLPSISRALMKLRKTKYVEFENGYLTIRNWKKLAALGDFNPGYLHVRKSNG